MSNVADITALLKEAREPHYHSAQSASEDKPCRGCFTTKLADALEAECAARLQSKTLTNKLLRRIATDIPGIRRQYWIDVLGGPNISETAEEIAELIRDLQPPTAGDAKERVMANQLSPDEVVRALAGRIGDAILGSEEDEMLIVAELRAAGIEKLIQSATRLVVDCSPTGIPGEKGYGVKMPERATVDELRAALALVLEGTAMPVDLIWVDLGIIYDSLTD